jgi:GT2 family glycosyltransferase
MYAYEAGAGAIRAHLSRCGLKGTVELKKDPGFYRVIYPVSGEPLVSIIIPNRDEAETLRKCISSVREKSTYRRYEILIIENNSVQAETFELYRELAKLENVRILRWKKEFNYSAINNFAAARAKGEYLLFLNNDVRGDISSDWLTEMLGVCQRKDVGAVGARLYYPNNRIQHAGIVIGIGGVAGAMFVDLPKGRGGYMHKAAIMQDLSAVTAACMLVKREAFEKAGGFTKELAVAFNDVDLCLKIGKNGYRIVYDPFAELYHDESRTRGAEDTPEKVKRFQSEIEYMRVHWLDIIKNGDPNYNPNLSLKKWNYSLRV